MFSPNQLVVYPAQGVGKVERIERQTIGGIDTEFYIVRILSNNVTRITSYNVCYTKLLRACIADQAGKAALAAATARSTSSAFASATRVITEPS